MTTRSPAVRKPMPPPSRTREKEKTFEDDMKKAVSNLSKAKGVLGDAHRKKNQKRWNVLQAYKEVWRLHMEEADDVPKDQWPEKIRITSKLLHLCVKLKQEKDYVSSVRSSPT